MVTPERTDREGLEKLINIPLAPTKVRWQTAPAGQGGNWSLGAVLWYPAEDAAQIAKGAAPLSGDSARVLARHARWLPESALQGNHVPKDDDALVELKGRLIEPTSFTNVDKSGLLLGEALVLPKDGLVYVWLTTM